MSVADNGQTVARIRELYAQQRFVDAFHVIRTALADGKRRGEDWRLIANAANTLDDRFAAAEAMMRWLRETPDTPHARYLCAEQLLASGRVNEAKDLNSAALQIFPQDAHLQFSAGNIFAQAGDIDESLVSYRRAFALNQHFIGAWERIARLKRFEPGDPDIALIEDLPARAASLGDDFLISAHYANADLYDKLDEPDRAFPHFEAAAMLVKKSVPYDMGEQLAPMKNALAVFDEALLRRFEGAGDPSAAPVFVIGAPRSGTTLVDQIISSHSKAAGAGETSVLRVAAHFLSGQGAADRAEQWRNAGERYLRLMTELTGEQERLINKDIGSIGSVGLISLMLPKAKIIFVEREPMDAAWSCFKMHFGGSLPWTFDFHDIAKYFSAFKTTRERWLERCPVAMHELRYEELVENQRSQTDELLSFCGLEPEPQCYAFHENRRAVATASITQVREPMYKSAVGSWRRYEKHLVPLAEKMAQAGLL